jgi:hypothetical protein
MGTWLKPHRCYNFAAERRHGRSIRMDKLERWRRYLAHCRAYEQHDLHGKFRDAIFSHDGPQHRWVGESRLWLENERSNNFDQRYAIQRLPFH